MSAERFTLDTNILVYAADRRAGARHAQAVDLVYRAVECDCVLTLQSLGEFYVAATRKAMASPADIAGQVRQWMDLFPIVTAGSAAIAPALSAAEKGRLSFWDALMLATATDEGCAVVLSEDMQDGFRFGGVRVVNPFAEARRAEVERLLGSAA